MGPAALAVIAVGYVPRAEAKGRRLVPLRNRTESRRLVKIFCHPKHGERPLVGFEAGSA